MIKIENTEIFGWNAAIRGMRNAMNSWDKSDSGWNGTYEYFNGSPDWRIGPNDLKLMKKLAKAGTDHRKFMRMIVVYLDIMAPLYWWKQFDTYKVGTVANSCSTMHKIVAKEFTLDDFSHEHLLNPYGVGNHLDYTISVLNYYRDIYLNGGTIPFENEDGDIVDKEYQPKDKDIWWQMIQSLPDTYNQRRTILLNYEVLANMYGSRKNHKLDEWHDFCDWIDTLPYSELITGKEDPKLSDAAQPSLALGA